MKNDKEMKKAFLLLEIFLICAQVMNAQQSPCEKTFNKAKGLFIDHNYSEAKVQFQKVVNNCDSNKEIAQEYIKLCDEWISVKDEGKTAIETNSRKINELNDEIANLRAEADVKAKTIRNANKIIEENEKALAEKTSDIEAKDLEIKNLKEQNGKLLSYQETEEEWANTIKEVGNELNGYLEKKLCGSNRKKIKDYDKVSDDSLIIVLKNNVKLVSEIKTLGLF